MQSSASRYIFYLLLCLFSLLLVKQDVCMSLLSRPKHGVGCNSQCLRISLASSFCSFTIVKIIISSTTILLISHSIVVLIIITNYWLSAFLSTMTLRIIENKELEATPWRIRKEVPKFAHFFSCRPHLLAIPCYFKNDKLLIVSFSIL